GSAAHQVRRGLRAAPARRGHSAQGSEVAGVLPYSGSMGSTRSRSIALLAATFALAVLVGRPDVTARQLGVGPLPLSPLLESPTAHAGTTIHAALRVAIPD